MYFSICRQMYVLRLPQSKDKTIKKEMTAGRVRGNCET